MIKENIFVTKPSLPDFNEFISELKKIWESKFLTNNGRYHKQFEKELRDYLKIDNISLFTNGTLALIVGLQALRITGEVITTPYSFVASTHALHWNGIKPIFCDINRHDFNLNANKIEALISPKTTAIMPVHVYGNPCDYDKIQKIANTYGLKIIYDAAHAFGVKKDEQTILDYGDISVLSFHATKAFNTVEGGAIVTKDKNLKKRIDYLKNFGFADETTVIGHGINGKMNELIAAYGLLQLKKIDHEIEKRKSLAFLYRDLLRKVKGIAIFEDHETVDHNYSYFPILIDQKQYGKSRDYVYEKLKESNIYSRRYFYPLISQFPAYRGLPSASKENLPIAEELTQKILCLPIYAELKEEVVHFIVKQIIKV